MDTLVRIAAMVHCVVKSTVKAEACASNIWFSLCSAIVQSIFNSVHILNRHVGDSNVKCMCPYGYRGNKCETHEFLDDEDGKSLTFLPNHVRLRAFYSQQTECNLSKDSLRSDDSVDSFACASKCLNELNNIELCRCHQYNELGKRKSIFNSSKMEFALIIIKNILFPIPFRKRDATSSVINLNLIFFSRHKLYYRWNISQNAIVSMSFLWSINKGNIKSWNIKFIKFSQFSAAMPETWLLL